MIDPLNFKVSYNIDDYRCNKWLHETEIFIETDYSMFGFMDTDKVCCICKEMKAIVSDGNLIWRYDWPDADDYPSNYKRL